MLSRVPVYTRIIIREMQLLANKPEIQSRMASLKIGQMALEEEFGPKFFRFPHPTSIPLWLPLRCAMSRLLSWKPHF
jgi:hypothetical protein